MIFIPNQLAEVNLSFWQPSYFDGRFYVPIPCALSQSWRTPPGQILPPNFRLKSSQSKSAIWRWTPISNLVTKGKRNTNVEKNVIEHHLSSKSRMLGMTSIFHFHTPPQKKQQWWPIDQRQGRGGPWAWASCLQGTQEGLKKTPWLSLHAVFWRLYSISFLLEPVSVVSHVPGVWRNQTSFWTLWTWMPKKLLSSKKLMKKI